VNISVTGDILALNFVHHEGVQVIAWSNFAAMKHDGGLLPFRDFTLRAKNQFPRTEIIPYR